MPDSSLFTFKHEMNTLLGSQDLDGNLTSDWFSGTAAGYGNTPGDAMGPEDRVLNPYIGGPYQYGAKAPIAQCPTDNGAYCPQWWTAGQWATHGGDPWNWHGQAMTWNLMFADGHVTFTETAVQTLSTSAYPFHRNH